MTQHRANSLAEPRIVYLAYPFAASPAANLARVNRIARKLVQLQFDRLGGLVVFPLVPHNVLSCLQEDTNSSPSIRGTAETISRKLVLACDELWLCSDTLSAGMVLEKEVAEKSEMPTLHLHEAMSQLFGDPPPNVYD